MRVCVCVCMRVCVCFEKINEDIYLGRMKMYYLGRHIFRFKFAYIQSIQFKTKYEYKRKKIKRSSCL